MATRGKTYKNVQQWHLKEEKFLMFEQGIVTFLHATLKFSKLLMTQPFTKVKDKGLLSQIGMKVWFGMTFVMGVELKSIMIDCDWYIS